MSIAYKYLRKSVRVNGMAVTLRNQKECANYPTVYKEVAPGWYTNFENFTLDLLLKLAGYNPQRVDYAVPQAWFIENHSEIVRRGGATWNYNSRLFGEPLYLDDVKRLAMRNLRNAAQECPV